MIEAYDTRYLIQKERNYEFNAPKYVTGVEFSKSAV